MKACSIFALAAVLASAGCGGSRLPALHPLKGQLLDSEGQGVSEGLLTFRSKNTDILVTAAVGPDGKFEAFTTDTRTRGAGKRRGAPEGTYQVAYIRPATDQAGAGQTSLAEPLVVSAGMSPPVLNLPAAKKK
jgi:hypothetical protein